MKMSIAASIIFLSLGLLHLLLGFRHGVTHFRRWVDAAGVPHPGGGVNLFFSVLFTLAGCSGLVQHF